MYTVGRYFLGARAVLATARWPRPVDSATNYRYRAMGGLTIV